MTPLNDPACYQPDAAVVDAVNVALALRQPLLVTGDPGTGKTELAASVAYQLGLRRPIVFNTKTTSTARDLFYQYDALRHFRDAQLGQGGDGPAKAPNPLDYIRFEALGLAILLSMPRGQAGRFLPEEYHSWPSEVVVLIDEIDKAPRDLPNDVLHEIDRMQFTVPEAGEKFMAPASAKPVVILTSNSEKALPDPFLRRCVYCHVQPPSAERLQAIVAARLGRDNPLPSWIPDAIKRFEEIRGRLRRRPATAEFLAWVKILQRLSAEHGGSPFAHPNFQSSLTTLIKAREDFEEQRK